jgi:hypothetical protein
MSIHSIGCHISWWTGTSRFAVCEFSFHSTGIWAINCSGPNCTSTNGSTVSLVCLHQARFAHPKHPVFAIVSPHYLYCIDHSCRAENGSDPSPTSTLSHQPGPPLAQQRFPSEIDADRCCSPRPQISLIRDAVRQQRRWWFHGMRYGTEMECPAIWNGRNRLSS